MRLFEFLIPIRQEDGEKQREREREEERRRKRDRRSLSSAKST